LADIAALLLHLLNAHAANVINSFATCFRDLILGRVERLEGAIEAFTSCDAISILPRRFFGAPQSHLGVL
jgi:hypothetical protein